MISIEKLKDLMTQGLDMNHYLLLYYLRNGINFQNLYTNPKVSGYLLTLERKELIVHTKNNEESIYTLTQEGNKILADEVINKPVAPDYFEVIQLHTKLKEKLKHITGKNQVVGFGNVYFIPSSKDLESFLNRFRRAYPELWDTNKIEKCLLKHIEKCANTGKYSPAVKYFIIKEGTGSQLAAMLENMEDTVDETEKQHRIINTEDLF